MIDWRDYHSRGDRKGFTPCVMVCSLCGNAGCRHQECRGSQVKQQYKNPVKSSGPAKTQANANANSTTCNCCHHCNCGTKTAFVTTPKSSPTPQPLSQNV